MSYPVYGRVQVPETPRALLRLHQHDGSSLHVASHEPPLGVLDQSDLIEQGIDTSVVIPGAKEVDALGSCTANGTLAALSNLLAEQAFLSATGCTDYGDTKGAEIAAIRFYHQCTDQTGDPATEWPPTDCGSSGPAIVSELERSKLAGGDRLAGTGESLVSLLQTDGVLQGSPWFYAWEEPDAQGFIDGDGSVAALETAIQSGVAGGHETYLWKVEKLVLDALGRPVPEKTVIVDRNSWGASWGDAGNCRIHLSTLLWLATHCDWRQLVAA